jgi:predicted Zn-dependent protease
VLKSRPKLVLDETPGVDSSASKGTEVRISLGLIQLINDSPSELAAIMAHQLGHIVQQRTGERLFSEDIEVDADCWAVFTVLFTGLDPYALSGALSKVMMVSGEQGFVREFDNQSATDVVHNIPSRILTQYSFMKWLCGLGPETGNFCQEYRGLFHPSFPESAPF